MILTPMLSDDVTRWESTLTLACNIGVHSLAPNAGIVNLVSSNVGLH